MNFHSLQDHLQYIVKNSSETHGNVNWTEVTDAIARRVQTVDAKSLHIVCPLLLDILRTRSCGDRDIAAGIIRTYYIYRSAFSVKLVFGPIQSPYYPLWGSRDRLRSGSTPSRILQPLYDRTLSSADFVLRNAKGHAWVALNAGDSKLLSALVQYGFWTGEMDNLRIVKEGVYIEFRHLCSYFGLTAGRYIEILQKSSKIWQSLQDNNGRMLSDNERGFSRISLIIRMLKAVALQPKIGSTMDYLQCLRMYVTVMPNPLVSSDEVQEFLLYLLREDEDRPLVDRFFKQYVEIFGEQHYGPRSLLHLCRCEVRKSLVANKTSTLPKLVETLNIPYTLKDFLLGAPERSLW